MKRIGPLLALLLAAACTSLPPPAADSLDAIAEEYVRAALEIGTHDANFVDAYYGPAEWREEAEADPRSAAELIAAIDALDARLAAVAVSEPLAQRRKAFLDAQLTVARTRLEMAGGTRYRFAEETRRLFGVTPELEPLESFDPVLERIDALVPGEGDLATRVETYRARFTIPDDRLETVMRRAIDECRARTVEHMALPEDERFTLEFVQDKSWSGYNWYQGDAASLIQINTDLPIRIERAADLGCHEGYPGHHVFNMLLERELADARGWAEISLYPLFSPQSLIAEGSATYGVDLAFPGEELAVFERDVLYPLAGLDPAEAGRYRALVDAVDELGGARVTIARDYLDGRIRRAEAIALNRRYLLVSAERAAQLVDFADEYRSYVINYDLGADMVEAAVKAAGEAPQARWARMEQILSEPTLPSDLE